MIQRTKKLVSIVIPACNEEETLGAVLRDILCETKKLPSYKFQIIVVNNNSKDRTEEVAKTYPVTVINQSVPGKGETLRKGFLESRGDYIIMLDADYSHCAEELSVFLRALDQGAMLVIGSRKMGGSDEYTGVRSIGNELLTWAFRFLWRIPLTDVLNGYKGFRRCVVELPLSSTGFEIEIELVKNALLCGGPVVEVGSHERARAGGEMKSHAVREGFRFLMAILKHGIIYHMQSLRR